MSTDRSRELTSRHYGAHRTQLTEYFDLPSLFSMSEYFGKSIAAIANSIGISILGLGVGPLLWNPLAQAIGHRPVYLISWTLFVPCTFWLAFSKDYTTFAAGRFFAGFTSGVCQVLPATSITHLYKPEWRGTALSLWSLLLILGPPTAPLITSAVTLAHEWQYTYYIVIIFTGLEWFLIFFFCGETHYTPPSAEELSAFEGRSSSPALTGKDDGDKSQGVVSGDLEDGYNGRSSNMPSGHVGFVYNPIKRPLHFLKQAFEPISFAIHIPLLLPAVWGALAFGWSVGITIVLPQVLGSPTYGFTRMLVGCCYIAILVGSVIGKFYGGYGSDWCVTFFTKRKGDGVRVPEYRLWNMILPAIIMLPALIVFGYGFGQRMAWWVPVIFGAGLYYIGVVATASVLQTYMAEIAPGGKSMSAVQLYNLFKTIFSFAVPFFLPDWLSLPSWEMGTAGTFGTSYLAQSLINTVGWLLIVALLIVAGKRIRKAQGTVRPTAA